MSGSRMIVGFMPLLDCASVVAAAECGFASAEGLDLRLVRETSWANIRDRLIVGQFHAAHMLGPMSIASSLGVGHLKVPMTAPVALGVGGNAITVSAALHAQMCRQTVDQDEPFDPIDPIWAGAALRAVVRERAAAGQPALVLAMVYPFSAHHYELRYWLSASGTDPDLDVRLVVMPPLFLVDAIREGQIDGFCVGEPWSSVAAAAGAGVIVTTASRIWPRSAEKVLGLRADWAEQHPAQRDALVRAIVRAALWCEDASNHAELARLLAGPRYVGVPAELLQQGLAGTLRTRRDGPLLTVTDFLRLAHTAATFPWPGHALWFYEQMVRWGQVDASSGAAATALHTYRPDLYRQAIAGLPIELPADDFKPERFFDGRQFLPTAQSAAR